MKKVLLLSVFIFRAIFLFAQMEKNAPRRSPFTFPDRISFMLKDLTQDPYYCKGSALSKQGTVINNMEVLNNTSVKVVVKGKEVEAKFRPPVFFSYHGEIRDTMQVIIDVPGFKKEIFTYYKKIHYSLYDDIVGVILTHEDRYINKIVVLMDEIEVNIKGDKKCYRVGEIGRPDNNPEGNARMLAKIPGFSVDKDGIYVDGERVEYIFIDAKNVYTDGSEWGREFFNELLRLSSSNR